MVEQETLDRSCSPPPLSNRDALPTVGNLEGDVDGEDPGEYPGERPVECRIGLRLPGRLLPPCPNDDLVGIFPLETLVEGSSTGVGACEASADGLGLRLWLLAVLMDGTWNIDFPAVPGPGVSICFPPPPELATIAAAEALPSILAGIKEEGAGEGGGGRGSTLLLPPLPGDGLPDGDGPPTSPPVKVATLSSRRRVFCLDNGARRPALPALLPSVLPPPPALLPTPPELARDNPAPPPLTLAVVISSDRESNVTSTGRWLFSTQETWNTSPTCK